MVGYGSGKLGDVKVPLGPPSEENHRSQVAKGETELEEKDSLLCPAAVKMKERQRKRDKKEGKSISCLLASLTAEERHALASLPIILRLSVCRVKTNNRKRETFFGRLI